MTADEITTRDLWAGSPAQGCKSSCFCPVPEVCWNLTPEEVAIEVQRRKDAGFVVVERSQGGITAVSYERTSE